MLCGMGHNVMCVKHVCSLYEFSIMVVIHGMEVPSCKWVNMEFLLKNLHF